MGSSFLFHEDFLYYSGESDVWNEKPTPKGTILYSVVTPIICSFGICGNTLSLMVLKRRELVGSIYTYLAVLAATDLSLSLMLFFGGLSRGALYYRGWATYDALVGLPLGGAINSLSIMATIGVTFDRVLYLWNPVQCTKPKFCDPKIARKLMAAALCISIILNIPYCFIFTWDDEDNLVTSDFFDSPFYTAFNWFMLITFAIIPAIILLLGNSFLIMSLRKARKIGARCRGKRKDHTNLTITLISIIVFFLISEVPSSLVSRTKAVSILFSGDHDKANSATLEIFRQICTLMGAINVTINFLFYYLFCPAFCKALVKTIRKVEKPRRSLQVNVFVLNGNVLDPQKRNAIHNKVKAKILEISRRSIESNFSFPPSLIAESTSSGNEGEINDYICKHQTCEEFGEHNEYIEIGDEYKCPIYSTIPEEPFENNSKEVTKNTYQSLY